MKTTLIALVSAAAFALVACKSEAPPPKPPAPKTTSSTSTTPVSGSTSAGYDSGASYGSDAKPEEKKTEGGRPMPPAAPTAAPAEGAKK